MSANITDVKKNCKTVANIIIDAKMKTKNVSSIE